MRRSERGKGSLTPRVGRSLRRDPGLIVCIDAYVIDVGISGVRERDVIWCVVECPGVGIPDKSKVLTRHRAHRYHDLLKIGSEIRFLRRSRGTPRLPSSVEFPSEPKVCVRLTSCHQGLGQGDEVGVVGASCPNSQRTNGSAGGVRRDYRHAERQGVAATLPRPEQPPEAASGSVHAGPTTTPGEIIGSDRRVCSGLCGKIGNAGGIGRACIGTLEKVGRRRSCGCWRRRGSNTPVDPKSRDKGHPRPRHYPARTARRSLNAGADA